MLTVSELFIYPIKSLGGFSVNDALVTDKGFQYDRRWMLVDNNNTFLTQRELPAMALLQVTLFPSGLKVFHKEKPGEVLTIPMDPQSTQNHVVKIFDETCEAVFASKEADEWFSTMLSRECRLVYMPDATRRLVDQQYAANNETTAFSDGFPFLAIGQASLDDLNSRLEKPILMNRFRPNIVIKGGEPYLEDFMQHFTINGIHFYGVKPCARCIITTTSQENATRSKEPLQTLATYRQRGHKIFFGQNLLAYGTGRITVGDSVESKEHPPLGDIPG